MSPQEAAELEAKFRELSYPQADVIPFPEQNIYRKHKSNFLTVFINRLVNVFRDHLQTQAQSDRRMIEDMKSTGNNPFCIR